MPETIKKAKAANGPAPAPVAKRTKTLSYDTGSVRSEDLFPELRAKKKPSNPAVPAVKSSTPPAPVKKIRKTEVTSSPKVVSSAPVAAGAARETTPRRATTPKAGVKTASPSGAAGTVRKSATPAQGVKKVAPAAAAPKRTQPATPEGRTEEPPRLKLIAGTGIGLTLLFVCLIILNASLQVSAITIEERMTVGDVTVRHETWERGNAIVDITSLDPNVADVDIFLIQDEFEPGYIHFLVSALKEGEVPVLIEYENKDQKIVRVTVEPPAPEPMTKDDKKSKADTLERVREFLRAGDELTQDADKSVENTWKAYASYQRALRTIRQIRLHQFLPEFKGLEEKIQKARDQIEVRYKKAEAEYQVARDRQMHWKARELLKVLMQIVPDPKDPRHMKNKTYMEYLHSDGVVGGN